MAQREKTKQIGLVIPHHFSTHKIFLDILSGIRKVLENANIGLLKHNSN